MTIGRLVSDTIQLRRAYSCDHDWRKFSDTEEQCHKCGVICTEDGKKNLARMAARFFGRPVPQ